MYRYVFGSVGLLVLAGMWLSREPNATHLPIKDQVNHSQAALRRNPQTSKVETSTREDETKNTAGAMSEVIKVYPARPSKGGSVKIEVEELASKKRLSREMALEIALSQISIKGALPEMHSIEDLGERIFVAPKQISREGKTTQKGRLTYVFRIQKDLVFVDVESGRIMLQKSLSHD